MKGITLIVVIYSRKDVGGPLFLHWENTALTCIVGIATPKQQFNYVV